MKVEFLWKNNIKNEIEKLNNLNEKNKSEYGKILSTVELDIIDFIAKMVDDNSLYIQFIKLENIKNKPNVEELLVENRKKMMKTIVKSYTKKCINDNILKPDSTYSMNDNVKSIDIVFNVVNNYYDSLYARFNNFDQNKKLPEYSDKELNKLHYDTYNKIKNNTGVNSIKTDYKKSKYSSFASYCVDTTLEYVKEFNNKVISNLKKDRGDADDIIDEDLSDFSETAIENVTVDEQNYVKIETKIPGVKLNGHRNQRLNNNVNFSFQSVSGETIVAMLKNSYEARSTAERFFSYFPFINPKAKEERIAMTTIEKLMEKTCHVSIDKEGLFSLNEKAIKKEMEKFYDKDLKELNYIEEKENIIISDINEPNEEKLIEEINDNVKEKSLSI